MTAFRDRPSIRTVLRILRVGAVALVVTAAPASAQRTGFAAIDRLPRYDWEVEQYELADVVERDLKKAYRRGIEDLKKGNCRDASTKFEFILGFIEDDPTIYYVAGTAARCMRAFRAAAGYYESTIEFEPKNYDAHRFLGISRLALGDLDEASEVLATLDLERVECGDECDPDLEAAYAGLRGALEFAQAYARENATENAAEK